MPFKRYAVAALLASLAASAGATTTARAQGASKVRIAVVDLQKALNETEDGRAAKARLKSLFDERQKSLDAAQTKVQKMQDELKKQKDVLSQDALQKKVETYQQAVSNLQDQYVEYQRELSGKEGELTQKILERMRDILRRIGEKDGYTLILEKSEGGVVWVPSNLDLTDEVIQRYNALSKQNHWGAAKPSGTAGKGSSH